MERGRPRWGFAAVLLAATLVSVAAVPPQAVAPQTTLAIKARLDEGFRLLGRKQLDAADAIFDEVLLQARSDKSLPTAGEAHRGRGMVRIERRDFAGAKRELGEARQIFEQTRNPLAVGHALTSLGIVAWFENDASGMRTFYEAALEAFTAAGAVRERVTALRNLTFVSQLTWEEREHLIAEAVDTLRAAPDPVLEGALRHQWGDILFALGRYAESLEKLEAARPLLEHATDSSVLPRLLTSLGRTYRVHGMLDQAMAGYRRALAMQERAGDFLGASQTESTIGAVLFRSDRQREALVHRERALALAERSGSPRAVAFQRMNLGGQYVAVGEPLRALPLLIENNNLGQSDDAMRLYSLAVAHRMLGDGEKALATAERAVARAGTEEAEVVLYVLSERALAHAALGHMDAAYTDHREALSVLERMRINLVPEDRFRQGFADLNREFFTSAVNLLAQMGRHGEALEITERGRARAFLDLLTTKELRANRTQPGATPSPRGGREAELRDLASAEPLRITEMKTALERRHSTLLSYWVTKDATFVWVVTTDGVVHFSRVSVTAERLTTLVRSLEPVGADADVPDDRALTDAARAPRPQVAARQPRSRQLRVRSGEQVVLSDNSTAATRELYDLLVKPVRASLPMTAGSLLTIVPHGPLFALSFAALKDARGRYLVEDYAMHYAPSVSALAQTMSRGPRPVPTGVLVVADPTLDSKLAARERLAPLPGARTEAAAITKRLAPRPVSLLTGAAATEREVVRIATTSGILHFATHGVVSDERPLESFLALAGGDGRLTSAKIYDLQLHAELVVLSACRSGRGRITGDGVIGLSRAFAYAGAPSLLATLWDLPDEAAWRLLPDFYTAWRRTGDKAKALREAQLALIRRLRAGQVTLDTPAGRFTLPEHPALWASFVLLGTS